MWLSNSIQRYLSKKKEKNYLNKDLYTMFIAEPQISENNQMSINRWKDKSNLLIKWDAIQKF